LAALALALAPLHFLAAHALGPVDWGAGFSGPLHGMVAAAGLELARRHDPRHRRFGRLTLVGLTAKLVADGVLGTRTAWSQPIPVAHALHWLAVAAALALWSARPALERAGQPVAPDRAAPDDERHR
jgi:hypothetical protein